MGTGDDFSLNALCGFRLLDFMLSTFYLRPDDAPKHNLTDVKDNINTPIRQLSLVLWNSSSSNAWDVSTDTNRGDLQFAGGQVHRHCLKICMKYCSPRRLCQPGSVLGCE